MRIPGWLAWTQADDRTARRRSGLVASLIVLRCIICGAEPLEYCDPHPPPPGDGYTRVDRDPPHVVHDTRAAAALAAGHVPRALLAAQYGDGPLPAFLTPSPHHQRR